MTGHTLIGYPQYKGTIRTTEEPSEYEGQARRANYLTLVLTLTQNA